AFHDPLRPKFAGDLLVAHFMRGRRQENRGEKERHAENGKNQKISEAERKHDQRRAEQSHAQAHGEPRAWTMPELLESRRPATGGEGRRAQRLAAPQEAGFARLGFGSCGRAHFLPGERYVTSLRALLAAQSKEFSAPRSGHCVKRGG